MHAISMPPSWGGNYTLGDIGFQFTDDSFISDGIVYFTDWENLSDIPISHAFVIKGPNTCTEALANGGVVDSPLTPRFHDSHVHVVIRRPVNLDLPRGVGIVHEATQLLGTPYDVRLIGGLAIANSHLVTWMPAKLYMPYRRRICKWFYTVGRLVCVGLCVKALNFVAAYRELLTEEFYTYDPQMLFEHPQVFKPWKKTYAHA